MTTDEEPYLLEGNGAFDYKGILIEEWGTYEVTPGMSGSVSGDCRAVGHTGELVIFLELSGFQMVVVTSEGFSGEYPWEGTLPFEYTFPLE